MGPESPKDKQIIKKIAEQFYEKGMRKLPDPDNKKVPDEAFTNTDLDIADALSEPDDSNSKED
jgi:hypothetical protein